MLSSLSHASTESTLSLLDNRFRIDSSVTEVTFVIYREDKSRPVVLIRPDGVKYYYGDTPDYIYWYDERGVDLIRIKNPMPGPWQAVGKITPKNQVHLISDLTLDMDAFPESLYEKERFKFTAELKTEGSHLILDDFLEKVDLTVTFTPIAEEGDGTLDKNVPKGSIEMGVFYDNGEGLDEVRNDGKFTAELYVNILPGKYTVKLISSSGIFLRAVEQIISIVEMPFKTLFLQANKSNDSHEIIVEGAEDIIKPGSLNLHIEKSNPDEEKSYFQNSSELQQMIVGVSWPYRDIAGNYEWKGSLYATDLTTGRALVFSLPVYEYSIFGETQVRRFDEEESNRLVERNYEVERAQEQLQLKIEEEKQQRSNIMVLIFVNLFIIFTGTGVWMYFKLKKNKLTVK